MNRPARMAPQLFNVDAESAAWLDAKAAAWGVSKAAIVRAAIAQLRASGRTVSAESKARSMELAAARRSRKARTERLGRAA